MARFGWMLLVPMLCGCVSTQLEVRHAKNEPPPKKPVPQAVKFGEYLAAPGQYAAKNPPAELPPANINALLPSKPEKSVERIDTLLTPASNDPPLVLAIRDYFEGRTEQAVARLRTLDPANQELILRLLPALVHSGRADLSGKNPSDAALLASQLEAALDATNKLAPMKIRRACFVWRVSQFGVYDPVPEKHPFLCGGAGVQYLELQNAPSTPAVIPAGGEGYVTKLECAYQVLDADGKAVFVKKAQPYAEYTRSPVRDYFLKLEFELPKEPGKYSLAVEIRDPASGRSVKHISDLTVANR